MGIGMCSVIVVVRGERGLAGGEQCGSDAISPTITVVDFLQWPVHMGEDADPATRGIICRGVTGGWGDVISPSIAVADFHWPATRPLDICCISLSPLPGLRCTLHRHPSYWCTLPSPVHNTEPCVPL